ncbi:MAG: radical SAM protein [candidate division Zixibacteria bacterium]|nr:radical SAM protein [candidate division Zixibacteria bacterium]
MTACTTPRYLRVSLLSGCNLNCTYCRPEGQSEPALIADSDRLNSAIEFLLRAGIRKVRFTGGEPTLHKDLAAVVAQVKAMDSGVHTAITTNGVLLGDLAPSLASAGLDSANISLDTLDRVRFQSITGRDQLDNVVHGIETAASYIGLVKLNCVLVRGTNDHEVSDLIRFANDRGLDIRFIEYMPNRFSAPGDPRFISGDEIRGRLPWNLKPSLISPSSATRYYSTLDLSIRVGFISPISHPFCSGCDRLRLAADGMLYACLFDSQAFNLYDVMVAGPRKADAELKKLVELKRFGGCRGAVDRPSELPSFSTLGG